MKYIKVKNVCIPGGKPQDVLLNVESISYIFKSKEGEYRVVVNNGGLALNNQDAAKIFDAIGMRL